jgi:hypothetical protein
MEWPFTEALPFTLAALPGTTLDFWASMVGARRLSRVDNGGGGWTREVQLFHVFLGWGVSLEGARRLDV